MGANQSQIKMESKTCLNGNLKNTPVLITETINNDGTETTTFSLSNFDGCSYNRKITINKSVDSKNLKYSVFYTNAEGSNMKRKAYNLEERFTDDLEGFADDLESFTYNQEKGFESDSESFESDSEGFESGSEGFTNAKRRKLENKKILPKYPSRLSINSKKTSKNTSKKKSKSIQNKKTNRLPIAQFNKNASTPITNDFPFSKENLLEYNDNHIYNLGTIIKYKNKLYRLTKFIGENGYRPDKFPNYWKNVTSVTNSAIPPKSKILPLDPLPEVRPSVNPISPDIMLNVGGPSWGQYVIKPNLVPSSIVLGDAIMAGFIRIVIADESVDYVDNNIYRLGDVVTYNKNNYINLSYNDPRGPTFQGSVMSSPDKDKNVWKQVTLSLPLGIPGKINVTSATYGLNCSPDLKDNRTTLFRKLTNNKVKLEYNYDYKITGGDPAAGCIKELDIIYNCGDGNKDKLIHLNGEAGNGGLVKFNCSPPPPITNSSFTFGSLKSATLVAWFDANDANADGSNLSSGSPITTWKDKSSNNNDAIKGSFGNPPIIVSNSLNNLAVLDLKGTTQLSFSLGSKLKAYTIFSVHFSKGPYTNWQRLLSGQRGGDGKLFYGLHTGVDTWMTGFGNGNWTDLNTNFPEKKTDGLWSFTDVVVNENIALPTFNSIVQNQKSMNLDGFDSIVIGSNSDGTHPWMGSVAEVLVFNGAMSNTDRQIIQGYLAWKWGLQNNLSDGHPYQYINMKVLPDPIPEINNRTFTFSNLRSANLIGWFDANDIYANGSKVSDKTQVKTWSDKSTSGNDAISLKNNPIVLDNKINNLSVLDLQGSTVLNVPFGYKLKQYSIFSVQFSKGDYSDWQRLISGQSDADGILFLGLRSGTDLWLSGLGTGSWTDLNTNQPEQNTDGKWYLADITVDTTSNTANQFFNGNLQNAKNVQMNGFDSITIGSQNGVGQFWKGLVGEILIFDGVISNDDRRIVQAYLAWKWGLQNRLSTSHPYKNINMQVLPNPKQEISNKTFKFSEIKSGSLLAWFDANDLKGDGSKISNGTQVRTWTDKSINGNDASQGATGNPPILVSDGLNNLSVINLQGSTALTFRIDPKVTSYTIFSVQFSKGPYDDWQRLLNGGSDGKLLYGLLNSADVWTTGFGNGKWTDLNANVPTKNTDGKWTFTDIVVDVAQNTVTPSFNGIAQNKKSMAIDGFDFMTIGSQNGLGQFWKGSVGEILIFNGLISDNERQIIQGYLASKWGLQKNLPNIHPYKYNKMSLLPDPLVIQEINNQTFRFSSIKSGSLLAWFDANDSKADGTVVSNGTEINTWVDKTINGNNAIKASQSDSPVIVSNSLNKLSVINLQGSTSFNFQLGSKVSTYSIFSVQFGKGPYEDWQRLLSGGNGTNLQNDGRLIYGLRSGVDIWMTGLGNGDWSDLDVNLPIEHVDSKWSFADITVNVPENTAKPSFNGFIQNTKNVELDGFTSMTIGSNGPNVTQPWNGLVAEILVFNGVINDSERQIIHAYLATKWGLQKKLPRNHPYKYVNMTLLPEPKIGKFISTSLNAQITTNEWLGSATPYVTMTRDGKYICIASRFNNIFLSSNYGSTWKPLRNGLSDPAWRFNSVYISNNAELIVYNTTENNNIPGTLFYSTDQGNTWISSNNTSNGYNELTSSFPSNIVGSDNGSVLYGGTNRVTQSVDKGKTWQIITDNPGLPNTGLNEGTIINMACSADGVFIIFARRDGSGKGSPWVSRDGGKIWTNQPSHPKIMIQGISCTSDGKIMATSCVGGGGNITIFVSTDYGNTWVPKKGPNDLKTNGMAFTLSGDGSTMVFGVRNDVGATIGIYLSNNLGNTWNLIPAPEYNWYSLASSFDGKLIVASPYISTSDPNKTKFVSIYNMKVESFANSIENTKYCILPNKKYINGILNEQINSNGSVVTTITIPPFDGCKSGKTITINLSSDMKKLVLENKFKGLDGNNIIETYNYKIFENNINYNKYITLIGIFIILCLLIFYLYKKKKNLLII